MKFVEFKDLFVKYKLIIPVYAQLLKLIDEQISDKSEKDELLKIFAIYFSLINDGDTCLSLKQKDAIIRIKQKISNLLIILEENNDNNIEDISKDFELINQELDKINFDILNSNEFNNIIGCKEDKTIFIKDDTNLYLRKFYLAKLGIEQTISKLFIEEKFNNNKPSIDLKKQLNENISLSNGQIEAVIKGAAGNNLIITGGPGTGKTSSILFILVNLLFDKNLDDWKIALLAPSGKAAARMEESIRSSADNLLNKDFRNNPKVVEILNKLEKIDGSTIHKKLEVDYKEGCFKHNEDKKFDKQTIFVIDEASMIDICLFNSLLSSIDPNSQVFIMGDKDQLPSVEEGAVFASLVNSSKLKDFIVTLDQSNRFPESSEIYKLASKINNGLDLGLNKEQFIPYNQYEINDDKVQKGHAPVFYYSDYSNDNDKEMVSFIIDKWYDKYFKGLFELCNNLQNNVTKECLDKIINAAECSRVLCAQKETKRGTKFINEYIRTKSLIDIQKKYGVKLASKTNWHKNYYPGQLLMINQNNKQLNLFNGNTGILVKFKNDNILYLMVKKDTKFIKNDLCKMESGKIFKLFDKYSFYPIHMISSSDIDGAYAITIHKSQGSDYENILIFLPNKEGHPLLNRQIVYTAITRTKSKTYIVSNLDRLNEAKDRVILRETNLKV